MNPYEPSLQRLIESARRAPLDDRDVSAPYGFSTRMAALAMTIERSSAHAFEHISLKAMGIACLFAVAAVAANYSSIARLFQDRAAVPQVADDPVAALVDIASS